MGHTSRNGVAIEEIKVNHTSFDHPPDTSTDANMRLEEIGAIGTRSYCQTTLKGKLQNGKTLGHRHPYLILNK
jgi:hypothetical protein